jgi:hypothetical protein
MRTNLHKLPIFLAFSLSPWLLLASACPGGDDDSAVADDDSTAADDDDSTATDDDDATTPPGDDDDDDDSTEAVDWTSASIPEFGDCSGNQWKAILGDGSAIGPFDGFLAEDSFANNFPNFAILVGVESDWSGLNGNRDGMSAGVEIPFQQPASQAGHVVLNTLVSANTVAGLPPELGGAYGVPTVNPDASVGGSVVFDTLPEPNTTSTGRFSAILQRSQGIQPGQVILIGVAGCFNAALSPTDL